MTKKKNTLQNKPSEPNENDSTYFLKIVLYIILGSLWLKFQTPLALGGFLLRGIPVGLFIGLLFASHDHFRMDRKIEYAILLLMTIVSLFMPVGIIL